MDRRQFLVGAGIAPVALASELHASRRLPGHRTVVLIDLLGGNDGANTLVPYSQAAYYRSRPGIAIGRNRVIPLADGHGLHPALSPLMALWDAGELAVLQGVGCSSGSLSHQRALEILDGASFEDRPLQTGWLTRALSAGEATRRALVQGCSAVGDRAGPLHGLARCRRLCGEAEDAASFGFPQDPLGCALASACALFAAGTHVPAIHVALDGFDTHENQPTAHGALLESFALSLSALRRALQALGRWQHTLVMTRSEFGRLAHENLSAGTDHGNAGVQFVAGGGLRGGLYGQPLDYGALDTRGAFLPTMDFRVAYEAVTEHWLGIAGAASASHGHELDTMFSA